MKVSRRSFAAAAISLSCTLALNGILPFSAALCAEKTLTEADLAARAMSLQTRIFGKAPANQKLSDRLAALETYLSGSVQGGDAEQRLTRVKEALDGKPRPAAAKEEDLAPVNDQLFDVTKSKEPVVEPDAVGKSWTPDGQRSAPGDAAEGGRNDVGGGGKVFLPTGEMPAAVPLDQISGEGGGIAASIDQEVKQLEERILGHSSGGNNLEVNLARMETFALGEPQAGTLEKRLSRLKGIFNGAPSTGPATDQIQEAEKEAQPGQTLPEKGGPEMAVPEKAAHEKAVPEKAVSEKPVPAQAVPEQAAQPVSGTESAGRTLHGRVDTIGISYGLAGISLKSSTLPTTVTVKPGSRALRAGLRDNDRLLHAELGIDSLSLAVERGGRKFALDVPLTDAIVANKPLRSGDVRLSSSAGTSVATATTPLKGTAAADWKVLKQYNIAVLLDVSGSMNGMQPEVGLSKNEWCQQQIGSLATEAERLGSGSFDFGTFTGKYTLTPNCTAAQVVQLLATTPPGGGTNIAAPLQAAIDSRSMHTLNKPFLIVVITDGLPGGGEPLDTLIVRAAQNARSAGDIKIVFLQIGRGNGQVLADFLDTQLTGEGAPYDIVSSIEWNELSRIGLRSGLIAALNKPADSGGALDPERAAAFADLRRRMAISKLRNEERAVMQGQRDQMRDFRRNNNTGVQNY